MPMENRELARLFRRYPKKGLRVKARFPFSNNNLDRDPLFERQSLDSLAYTASREAVVHD